MIHGDNNGFACVSVENSFEPDHFTDVAHTMLRFVVSIKKAVKIFYLHGLFKYGEKPWSAGLPRLLVRLTDEGFQRTPRQTGAKIIEPEIKYA